MRAFRIYLLLLLLLLVSLAAGFVAADWPTWCSRAHWCAPGWPHHGVDPAGRTADTPPT